MVGVLMKRINLYIETHLEKNECEETWGEDVLLLAKERGIE